MSGGEGSSSVTSRQHRSGRGGGDVVSGDGITNRADVVTGDVVAAVTCGSDPIYTHTFPGKNDPWRVSDTETRSVDLASHGRTQRMPLVASTSQSPASPDQTCSHTLLPHTVIADTLQRIVVE